MPEIKQLPPSVVNKIAAGEVIERPASVVKELMENAVDAGATRIDVLLEQGGMQLIRVADNGCGIDEDQLLLAVNSHATSKISDAEELFQVRTLGFRGEALASIAEVSQMCLRSRPAGSEVGAELLVHGGRLEGPAPCGSPEGTVVEVRNLFFNTPVRKRFLRTTQTEMGRCSEAFTRIALAFPRIHFTLRHNERQQQDLPPVESWRDRIVAFFGDEMNDALIPIESRDGDVHLQGYAADPNLSRGNNRMQYLFLNGRHIRDRALGHALGEAYRGLLLTGRHAVAFLRLDLPPDLVDVNVHPSKLEVRFQDSGRLYSQLLGTLRKKFLTTDLTAKIHASPSDDARDGSAAHDPASTDQQRSELIDWAKGQLGQAGASEAGGFTNASPDESLQTSLDLRYDQSGDSLMRLTRLDQSWPAMGRTSPAAAAAVSADEQRDALPQPPSERQEHLGRGLQLHDRYLITENEEGIMIIDQHALHERIIYEQLREKVMKEKIETQRLLAPEPVSLTPREAAEALDAREVLAKLGIEIEPFGGDTVLISSYPAMLANLDPAEVLRQVVEQLLSGGKTPDRRDILDELLHMISCKAAIKAGDRLTPEEINALLQQRGLCQDAHHCPHGRPTALVFTKTELDRRFKRI